jgi:hypothetical protein
MQHSIIGYLLGALDDEELAKFEAQLKVDPELQAQVREAAKSLECLRDDGDEFEPPAGLVESTCSLVEELRHMPQPTGESSEDLFELGFAASEASHPYRSANVVQRGYAGGGSDNERWTLVDIFVACSIVLIACLLLFPTINNSRYHAQIASCQNNLRSIGRALIAFSDADPNNSFPQVPQDGNLAFAGMYAPTLKSFGFVDDDSLFRCAASSFGFDRPTSETFRIPAIEELEQTDGEELLALQQRAGGDFGYTLGVMKNGDLTAVKNQSRNHFALMSDSPTLYQVVRFTPRMKRELHRNVLFESGCVRVVCVETECWCGDQIYTNDDGYVSAGVHDADAVIGASVASPMIRNVSCSN